MNNVIGQYLDLYYHNRQELESHCSALLNSSRQKAADSLAALTLPEQGSENYEITSLEDILAPDYGVNIRRFRSDINPAKSFHCGVPRLSTSLFMMVNDSYAEIEKSRNGLPDGLTVGGLNRISAENPSLLAPYYAKIASPGNPLVALDTMLVQDGFVIHVAKGVKVEKPLQLINILAGSMPMMVIRRILIVAEDDAEVTLLTCDHTQTENIQLLNLQTVEIYAGKNAKISLYELEESSADTRRLSTLYLHQEEDSSILINGMTLYNGHTRNEYYTKFTGRNSELSLSGMGIADRSRVIDTFTRVEHEAGHCHTDELFKFVLDDSAKGAFTGMIKVFEGAVKTEAYQASRNIVGSDSARMFSKPQLEIYNDDVKCSHGSAIGQLDEMQLFYMRTRGLDEATAKLLLKQAFLADVIDRVGLSALRDRLTHLVAMRFAGADSACSSCHAMDECETGLLF